MALGLRERGVLGYRAEHRHVALGSVALDQRDQPLAGLARALFTQGDLPLACNELEAVLPEKVVPRHVLDLGE